MFYFKTISINNADPLLVEKAIRNSTKIRNSYLDFLITAVETHDDKIFAGLEKKNRLVITRMKERSKLYVSGNFNPRRYRSVPTVFVRFKKDKGFSSYQIRLGFFSMMIIFIISFWSVFGVWRLLNGHIELGLLFFGPLFLVIFLLIVYREINKTSSLINKAIGL